MEQRNKNVRTEWDSRYSGRSSAAGEGMVFVPDQFNGTTKKQREKFYAGWLNDCMRISYPEKNKKRESTVAESAELMLQETLAVVVGRNSDVNIQYPRRGNPMWELVASAQVGKKLQRIEIKSFDLSDVLSQALNWINSISRA